jgi:DNA polymerase-1
MKKGIYTQMNQNKYLQNILDNIKDNSVEEGKLIPSKILLIDSLNLFFRNFAVLNHINSNGAHIGGVGGFLRSLGHLINYTEATEVYLIFDGRGSSTNRRNIIPEYKQARNLHRITNWEIFDDKNEEVDSQITQIQRIIEYLHTLPVKILSIDKLEADDCISFLSRYFNKIDKTNIIVSSDQDFLQLLNNKKTIVYRPIEKKYYTADTILQKYNILPENFIIYKTLLGDASDKIEGIKGLGPKKINSLFPELRDYKVSLKDILDISISKKENHIIYNRIILEYDRLKKNYLVMDLGEPLINDLQKEEILKCVNQELNEYNPNLFNMMANKDGVYKIIPNISLWLHNTFNKLKL